MEDIWPLFSSSCLSCHQNSDSGFPLLAATEFSAGDINFDRIKEYGTNLKDYIANINGIHEGGEIFAINSTEYEIISSFMDDLTSCDDDTVIEAN